jgi:predicted nucleotidyltransferase
MRFGLSETEYEFITETIVKPLAAHGATVWCFGSRARGNNLRFSDLDLMVDAPADLQSQLDELAEQLVESNFPYKVDIVQLRSFAKAYLENFYVERVLWDSGLKSEKSQP